MPISEIGKNKAYYQSGYTLIEILAVLIILGLIGMLAFPRYERGEEKAYLRQIGKLVQADIQTVSEESVSEKFEIVVEFIENGYHFEIGDTVIRRSFDKFQFRWDFSLNELDESEAIEEKETLGLPDEDGDMPDLGSSRLYFTGDGVYPETTLEWTTRNFIGSMVFKADGSMNWEFKARKSSI